MKKSNWVISLVLIILLMLNNFAIVSASENDIKVIINGQTIVFDVLPQIINDRTMVPMRKIFESLGAVVTWDESTRTATGKKDDVIVNVSIDSNILLNNGEAKTLDVAPALIDGRTLVPVRAIAESFDCNVNWVAETRTVRITTNDIPPTKRPLTATEISEKVSPSVFYIEVYDEDINALSSGSGFFISESGVGVTNYHVIEDTAHALIVTTSGEAYDVTDVIAFDKDLDVAIIRISKTSFDGKSVSGFPAVQMADSDNIKAGQTIYALGSPQGFQNTISSGIISNPRRILEENTFIQFTAPISPGSSGGALVNEYGEVLGITCGGRDDAQNINFAIPINVVKQFDMNAKGVPYPEFSKTATSFVLELYPESIEITVGETAEVLVYAEGKGDWSIYWDAENKNIVNCEWGNWFKDEPNICPLYVKGLAAGTTTIVVYSNVDSQKKYITVRVKQPPIATYPGTDIPTYTAITGISLANYIYMPKSGNVYYDCHCYKYNYYDKQAPQIYLDYLTDNGFIYEGEQIHSDGTQFFYKSPNGRQFDFGVSYKYNEVRIFVYINY